MKIKDMPDEIPYYHRTIDWGKLVEAYPPPPGFFEKVFFRWTRADIERVQEKRLLDLVHRAWQNPFYRRLWSRAGVSPEDIRSLEDLARLPIYTIQDYRESLEILPPFGDYQGAFFPDVRQTPLRVFTSGGTTGRARPMIYTQWDWEVYAIMLSRIMYLQGIRPGDVILNCMTYGLHVGAFAIDTTFWQWLGCTVITTSSGRVTPIQRQIETARDWGATIVLGITDYLVHLFRIASEMGVDIRRDTQIRQLSTAGDPRPVEAAWGLPAYDFFGGNEYGMISSECRQRAGLHIWEDAIIPEVVDLETNGPLEPGQTGNLVITALYKTGSPVIRFNTRDLTRIMPEEKCLCGSLFKRMDHHLGRSDTMVKLRGVNVWPEACGEVVRRDSRATGEYFCYVERLGSPPDLRDEMTVMVEHREGETDTAGLKKALEDRLREELEVRINVDITPPGSLARITSSGIDPKIRRFEDRRPKG